MQTDLNSIVEAIERVVVAPYTPSLHSLETRVECVSDNVVRQWTECKPCQVSLFAAVLLEQCHSAKKLLGRFGQIGCVRDALLHHDPTFLDQMLQGAIENANLQDLDVCVSLLSSPVPDNIPISARVPALLARLLGDVAQNPCAERIKPLYNIMQGLLSNEGLLQLMPESLMSTFQRESTMILKSLNDPLATLLSLATFARIRRLWKPKNDSGTQPQWLEKICLVFGPKSSNKTLDLVIIGAIMACSSSSTNLAPSERVLLVRLAIEICHEIDEELRKTWLKAHSQKLVKLCEKVKRTDIDPELRVLGLFLLFTFSKCLTLPTDIVQLMREQLYNPIAYDVIIATPDAVIEMFFDQLLAHSEDDYVTLCMATTERLNTKTPGYIDGIFNSRVDHILISALAKSERGSVARRSFRERLSQSEFRLAALHQYAEEFSTRCASRRCEASQVCYAKVELERDKTFLEILGCIYPTDDGTKNHGLQKLFIQSLKRLRVSSSGCVFASLKTLERKRYFPQQAAKPVVHTTSTDFSSHEWRAKLATLLTENAKTSHETVIQQMEGMLADLENRCDTVEEPLRLAVKEREDLNRQLEDSNQRNQQLEEKFKQATEIIHGLNRKLDEAAAQSQDYSAKIARLTGQLDALRVEHESVRRDAQDGLEAERLKARDRELDLMVTVAERDELLEEQQVEIAAVIKAKARLQEELDNRAKQHQVLSRECDNLLSNMARLQKDAAQDRESLQYEITKLQQVMEIRDSTNAEKDNRIRMLGEINRDIHNENQTLKSKLEQAETKLEKSASSLEEARALYKSGLADIELEYKNRLESTDKKIQQLVENHESEISRLRHDVAIASTKVQKEVRAKDKRIQYLEKKVDALRTERAAKYREFSEAQEHISRLMSVMGFNKETTASNSNKKQTNTGSTRIGKPVRRSSRLSMLQAQPGTESQMEMTTNLQTQESISVLIQSEYLPRRVSLENEVRRQPLGKLDQNSPNKSLHSSNAKDAIQDRSSHVPQVKSQGDMHVTQAGDVDVDVDLDLDLDFDDEDLLTSTIRA